MTVSVVEGRSGPYYPNGVTVAFPFDFTIVAENELQVFLIDDNGVEEVIDPASYSVTPAVDGEGGTVTMAIAPVDDGRSLWLASNPSFEQQTLFEDEGPFNSAILNPALDRAAIRDIWLRDRVQRAFLLPDNAGDGAYDGKFPVVLPGGGRGFSSGTGNDPALRSDLADPNNGLRLIATDEGDAAEALLARARTAISIAALAALPSPVVGQTAVLAENRRGGVFTAIAYADAGVAALVAADTQKGVMVRSTDEPAIVWRRQYLGEIDVRWFGAIPDAVIDPDGTVTSGTSCHVAFHAARAFGVATGKPFALVMQGGDYFTTAALRFVNDMTVIVRGSHVFGKATGLTASLGHQQRSVFTMAGVEPGSPAFGSGDYFETAPLSFNTSLNVPAGVTGLTAAAGAAAGLVDGDWLHVYEGHPGWHPFFSEYVPVADIDGDQIITGKPTRFPYNATSTGIGAFCRDHKFGGNPPGVTGARSWPVAGFRKVVPIRNARLKCEEGGKISNLLTSTGAGGFAVFAAFAWCAIDCIWEGLDTQGGGLWALDCQDFKMKGGVKIDLPYVPSTLPTTDRSLLINGSNNVEIERPHLESCSLVLEEFCDTVLVKQVFIRGGTLRGLAAARNVTLEGPNKIVGPDGSYGASFGGDDYEFGIYNWKMSGLDMASDGGTLLLYTPTVWSAHPNILLKYVPVVEKFYSGGQITLRDSRLVSDQQNGATMFLSQRIRCDNVEIGKDGASDIASPFGAGAVIGSLRRIHGGQVVGARKYSGSLPTFFGELGDVAFKSDGTARKEVIYTRRRYEGITAQAGKVLTIAGFAEEGSYAVGDVVGLVGSDGGSSIFQVQNIVATSGSAVFTVPDTTGMTAFMAVTGLMIPSGTLIQSVDSGTQITLTNAATFSTVASQGHMLTIGSRKNRHETTIVAVDAGASTIEIADDFPTGYIAWLASYGAGGFIEVCRWA